MIVSVTKLELISYSRLVAFIKLNGQIIKELKQSKCLKFDVTGNWNFKVWYTMTVWEKESDLNDFYRHRMHLEAMKQSKSFSPKIQAKRLVVDQPNLLNWKDAKKLFLT